MVLRALVVDPNPVRGLMYRELLASEGLDAFVVPDGRQACNFLESGERICLLVTELSLPRIDGFGVLRRLQRTDSAGIPVLVATAFREMRETALRLREELGISAVVSPTMSAEVLLDVVVRILEGEEEIVADESAFDTLDADDPVALAAAYQAELRRLESIRKAGITESNAITDAELEALDERVARRFEVPISLVSIVLRDRQWFKARFGTELAETPLDVSFCRHVVAAKDTLVVPDAMIHPTFANQRAVNDGAVRGYAGVPLIGSDGEAWGALCVIDPTQPLFLSARDLTNLASVAREVVAQIEARILLSNPPMALESGFRIRCPRPS
jgi:CheY-like chemotaxis protein